MSEPEDSSRRFEEIDPAAVAAALELHRAEPNIMPDQQFRDLMTGLGRFGAENDQRGRMTGRNYRKDCRLRPSLRELAAEGQHHHEPGRAVPQNHYRVQRGLVGVGFRRESTLNIPT